MQILWSGCSYQDGLGRTTQTLDHVVVVHILIWDKRKSQINEYSDDGFLNYLIVSSINSTKQIGFYNANFLGNIRLIFIYTHKDLKIVGLSLTRYKLLKLVVFISLKVIQW